MRYSPLINNVLKFVYDAHQGQIDKSGVPETKVVYNHAVTIDELKEFYNIFDKYEGNAPLDMQTN